MWRHFAGRDFPLEGFCKRLFPVEGFELGGISPHSLFNFMAFPSFFTFGLTATAATTATAAALLTFLFVFCKLE